MLDVKKLERRWLKYKIKKLLPFLYFFLGSVAVIITALQWINQPSSKPTSSTQPQNRIPPKQPQPKAVQTIEENTTVLEPSMGFVQNFELTSPRDESPKISVSTVAKQPQKTVQLPSKALETDEYPSSLKAPPATTKNPTRENSLSINRNESKLDIENLKLRFKETSNANLGLFIARYYYDHGDYNEAYNFALKTNTINSRIDESWIIFSKSLVKLGKPEQAKKTLQLYVSQSNSESAKTLLDSIERGAFK